MKTAILNVKTDKILKQRAQKFASQTGMTLSDLVNLSLRQVVEAQRLVIEPPLVPNAKTAKILRQTQKDIKTGRNMSPRFNDVDEAFDWLDKHGGDKNLWS